METANIGPMETNFQVNQGSSSGIGLRRRAMIGIACAVGLIAPLTMPVAALATPVGAAGTAAGTCRQVALPVPPGTTFSRVRGGDPTGTFLVGEGDIGADEESERVMLLWHDRRVSRIDTTDLRPFLAVWLNDVNSRGVVIGDRVTSMMRLEAFTYHAGRFTALPPVRPGDETETAAINSRGDVIGRSGPNVVIWPARSPATVRVLLDADGQPAVGLPRDIDEDGTAVGLTGVYPPGTPYVWPASGRSHALPMAPGDSGGEANAIRFGRVAGSVGHFEGSTGMWVLTRWDLRNGATVELTGVNGGAVAINRWGTIATFDAIVHRDNRVVPLGWVRVVTDSGVAAGATDQFLGSAVLWIGC